MKTHKTKLNSIKDYYTITSALSLLLSHFGDPLETDDKHINKGIQHLIKYCMNHEIGIYDSTRKASNVILHEASTEEMLVYLNDLK